ncbi:hypothetical protein LOC68_18225 [Blastopirellula sp. JC732]|uniref:Damage-inducible protein DinB n=1 Tax=Blastopirellula sediminis TaxID=2894196 RepID=A0A9X1MP50_9BACT|nr:DinB family protein [Blastopirellula sediminis]MCC9606366.1 hypothetical protein [Blastopirellula sediminis]MCC9630336.1 hypothetical protein [Blastopirellula sediminis]
MPRTLIDQAIRWLAYEQDAHAKTLASMAEVPTEKHADPDFKKAIRIMAHLAVARHKWMVRMGRALEMHANFFPENWTLETLAAELAASHELWEGYLGSLEDDAQLEEYFEYVSSDAGPCRSMLGDVVTQLFGHSWYHRGQVAMLVKSLGVQPAATDFIYWSREIIA